MKKIIALLLAMALILALGGCSKEVERSLELIQIETTDQQTITLTLPMIMFDGAEDFDLEEYLRQNGFLSGRWLADGSAEVTMTPERHKEAIQEVLGSVKANFTAILEAKNTSYVKDITYSDTLDQVKLQVIRKEYEKAFDLTPSLVSMVVRVYQAFLDIPYHVEVSIADVDTGEVFETFVFPEA